MLLPLLLFIAPVPQSVHTVELYRGAAVPGLAPRYWSVEDTTLDSTQAELNQGWEHELYGGNGKSILIQFKDLNRVLGPNKRIVKASIILALAGGDKVSFTGANQVLVPWNQGAEKTIMSLNPDPTQDTAARWAATWRQRRTGAAGGGWSRAGALGDADSKPIPEAKLSHPDADHISIDGLESAFENGYERPFQNNGVLFKFDAPTEFLSSKSTVDRPRLVLQFEDVAPKGGPDLTVTYIERKPDYERYQAEGGYVEASQDGFPVPVLEHPINFLSKKWPSDGEDLVYIAHVKNVGDAESQPFDVQWFENEKGGATAPNPTGLKPGEEATFTIHVPYKALHLDHRVQPLGIEIKPKGPDATLGNNFLEIQQSALNIGIYVEQSLLANFKGETAVGSHSFEDWIQQQVAGLNTVIFANSRFSFATDGVTERLRIGKIVAVPDGSLPKLGQDMPLGKNSLSFDAELGFSARDGITFNKDIDLHVVKDLLVSLGLTDFALLATPASPRALEGTTAEVGTLDMYPGIMGGGDTRDESPIPRSFPLPYQPFRNEIADSAKLESTDLLSATDVAQFQWDLGRRRGYKGDALYDTPNGVALNVVDYNGQRIPNAKLTFYPMAGGSFSSKTAPISIKADAKGTAQLFTRDPQSALKAGNTNHFLVPNPFGRIDYRGMNGTLLVKAEANNSTAWSTLKVWHLSDTFHRGQHGLALMTLGFDLPSDPLDESDDVAKGKSLSTSDKGDVAELLSGARAKAIQLPSKPGSWIELDLGRDRTVGELRLYVNSPSMWNQFDIRCYATAEKPEQAQLWSREQNWGWSFGNRRRSEGGWVASVPFHGPARRFRYLRIINTGADSKAQLVGVSVFPIKQTGEGG